jgi:molecular chaperone DnaK (HSP70)
MLKNRVDSLLRNTKKSFIKFGGMLPQEQQEQAEQVFADANAAVKTDRIDEIKKALTRLEVIAGQLTSAMLSASTDVTASEP